MTAKKNPSESLQADDGQKQKTDGLYFTGIRLNQQDFLNFFIRAVIQLQHFEKFLLVAVSLLAGGVSI